MLLPMQVTWANDLPEQVKSERTFSFATHLLIRSFLCLIYNVFN